MSEHAALIADVLALVVSREGGVSGGGGAAARAVFDFTLRAEATVAGTLRPRLRHLNVALALALARPSAPLALKAFEAQDKAEGGPAAFTPRPRPVKWTAIFSFGRWNVRATPSLEGRVLGSVGSGTVLTGVEDPVVSLLLRDIFI